MTGDLANIFSNMVGKWEARRLLFNQHSPALSGSGYGEVIISNISEDILLYAENISLKLDNNFASEEKFQGRVNYHLQLQNNIFCQYRFPYTRNFETKELMFEMMPRKNYNEFISAKSYICGRDIYNAQYLFSDKNQWSVLYKATGPSKNYVVKTKLQRY